MNVALKRETGPHANLAQSSGDTSGVTCLPPHSKSPLKSDECMKPKDVGCLLLPLCALSFWP